MYTFGSSPLHITQTGNHSFASGVDTEVALFRAQSFECIFYRPVDDTGNNVVGHGRLHTPAGICADFPAL